ncbi:shikimate kinase [Crocosphaera sp. UHCC 0190]|uniref:shikimate kinase n=1 Tax=Crocosphaera sp. UHCC 0190 TaxID=3110246 RepID=UPI002B21127F|nr:shikimate kinase [Crocosphaera sp. UHCC 0190]MEA5510893.1 shikimate kinase [Crocosphaera sp. UHCC 0190]
MQQLLQGVNIFLIGMMGTGKTTVGQVLAKRLSYRFFDTDVLIERVTQQTINDIFATEGEEAFRDIESQVLAELAAYTKSIIATGGGIILQQKNWSYLHHGLIIWLDSPVDLLIKRLAEDTTRPLLKATDLNLKLEFLLEQRRSLYAQSDLHIRINDQQTPDDIVTQILAMIPTVIKPKLEIFQNNN